MRPQLEITMSPLNYTFTFTRLIERPLEVSFCFAFSAYGMPECGQV